MPSSSAVFNVQLKVDPSKLPNWNMYGGAIQGNGAALNAVEFDGYLNISAGAETIRMALASAAAQGRRQCARPPAAWCSRLPTRSR